MLFTALYKKIQLILCRIELSLLARPSTIFSVSHVAPLKKIIAPPVLDNTCISVTFLYSR